MATILDLPAEILDLIIDIVLEPSSSTGCPESSRYAIIYALRSTCRLLHAHLATPAIAERSQREHANSSTIASGKRISQLYDLFRMERWPSYTAHPPCLDTKQICPVGYQYAYVALYEGRPEDNRPASSTPPTPVSTGVKEPWRDHLPPRSMHACTYCLLLRPSERFSLAQLTTSRPIYARNDGHTLVQGPARSHSYSVTIKAQACITCQIKRGTYSDRTPVLRYVTDWEGEGKLRTGVVCKRCRNFVEADPQSQTALARKCEQCREYRPRTNAVAVH